MAQIHCCRFLFLFNLQAKTKVSAGRCFHFQFKYCNGLCASAGTISGGWEANVFFGFPGKGEYRQSLVKTFNISRKLISF